MNTRRDRYPTILATLAVAALLMLLPLPNWLQVAWPYWMALTLIYWCLETQGRITLGLGFTVGIVLDLLMGSLLLFFALAAVMLVTRRVDWYRLGPMLRLPESGIAQDASDASSSTGSA